MNHLPIPDFDIQDETTHKCEQCKVAVPIDLNFIQPMFIGDRYIDVCPKCALGIRNLLMGLPRKAHFSGDMANELYFQFISWLENQERK